MFVECGNNNVEVVIWDIKWCLINRNICNSSN